MVNTGSEQGQFSCMSLEKPSPKSPPGTDKSMGSDGASGASDDGMCITNLKIQIDCSLHNFYSNLLYMIDDVYYEAYSFL